MMTFKRIGLFLCLIFSLTVLCADPASDFNQGSDAAKSGTQQAIEHVEKFDPSSAFPASLPPTETKYQSNPDAMIQDSQAAAANDPSAKAAISSITDGKEITINPHSPGVVATHNAQKSAADIVHGISDPSFNCIQPICQTTWTEEHCNQGSQQPVSCVSDLTVLVKPGTNPISTSGTFDINSGQALFPQGEIKSISVTVHGRKFAFCVGTATLSINGVAIQKLNVECSPDKQYIFTNNSLSIQSDGKSPLKLSMDTPMDNVDWSGGSWTGVIDEATHTEEDVWSGDCQSLTTLCKTTSKLCTQGASTKTIDGYAVTRSCWEQTTNLLCGSSVQPVNTCTPLIQSGCVAVSHDVDGSTVMNCPTQSCSGTQNVCGNGARYCIDGNCYQGNPSASSSFGKSGSEFAAASQGAAQGASSPASPNIFTGQAMHCSDKLIGSITCCSDHGWINHLIPDLAQCNEEEHKLGIAREKKLAIALPDMNHPAEKYCSIKIAGICFEYKEGYCVFNDYLSYDVQFYGRGQQLGIPFGDGKNPDCRGLTISEIQQINFSKINFDNFYKTYQDNTKIPNQNELQQAIENDINKQIGGR